MKKYEINISALSSKTVKVLAKNSKAAVELAEKIYNKTDLLNFNDDDVENIFVEVSDSQDLNPDDFCEECSDSWKAEICGIVLSSNDFGYPNSLVMGYCP